jgi:hypothetical protein
MSPGGDSRMPGALGGGFGGVGLAKRTVRGRIDTGDATGKSGTRGHFNPLMARCGSTCLCLASDQNSVWYFRRCPGVRRCRHSFDGRRSRLGTGHACHFEQPNIPHRYVWLRYRCGRFTRWPLEGEGRGSCGTSADAERGRGDQLWQWRRTWMGNWPTKVACCSCHSAHRRGREGALNSQQESSKC